MKFIITAGNVNDCTKAKKLPGNIIRAGVRVLADRGYEKILSYIPAAQEQGLPAEIQQTGIQEPQSD